MNQERQGWRVVTLHTFLGKWVFLLLLSLFLASTALAEQSVIKIENAQKTEYAKNPASGEDEIMLSGAVLVSVTRGTETTKITASKIIYNRQTTMLYAEGSVTLKTGGGTEGGQDISAETLLFNTSTMEGVFDNGRVVQTQSDAINLPSDATLIVSSGMFGRDSGGTVAFKNATLTFCDEDDPHWKIRSSRIWLLPGGEFAFFNAVLFIGHIPVLYLPAFYYPKDELIFNPSFGYSARRGYYMQTTTYIFGRKPLNADSSSSDDDDVGKGIYNFMRSTSLKEQKREGLVLHNLDTNFTGSTDSYLKVMADYYTTLGGMFGLEGAVKPKAFISSLQGGLELGLSNTVFYNGATDSYLPYSSSGETYSDDSYFLGLELPFRYSAHIHLSVTKPLSFTLQVPLYSDPYFYDDFGTRSEYMDWIGFLLNGAEDEDDDTTNTISTFTWSATGSYSIPLPTFVKPYVNTVSISSFSSSLIFNTKNSNFTTEKTDNWAQYTPRRSFYYPSQVTPFKISGTISGTLVQYPRTETKASSARVEFPFALSTPADFSDGNSNAELGNEDDALAQENDEPAQNSAEEETAFLSPLALPVLDTPSFSTTSFSGISYLLSYSISPQYTSQLTYDASLLTQASDFEWEQVQSSYFQITSPASLTSDFSFRNSFFSMKNVLTFSPAYQKHPTLDGYSESSVKSITRADYNAQKIDITNTNTLSLKPFVYVDMFKNSGLSWNTTLKLLQTKFLADKEDWEEHPEWQYITPWQYFTDSEDELDTKNLVTTHTLSATFAANESSNFSQQLVLSTTLPPQTDSYTATLSLIFPYTNVSFSTGIKKREATESTEETWQKEPFQQSLSVKLFSSSLTFSESFNYNAEDSHSESLKFSLSWKTLQLSYTMAYTYGYDFDNGWNIRAEKEFLAQNISLTYSLPSTTYRYWSERITWAPLLSTSLVYDCIRPTNSYFRFAPSLTFKINDLLNLTFSSESRNSVIYRYVQNFSNTDIQLSGETNPFIDLWNSFSFWDETKRKNSGFKVKSLKVSITHSLHDWDLAASYSVSPRLTTVQGRPQYSFDPYITLSVVWKPLSSMKAEVVDNYGEWQLNP